MTINNVLLVPAYLTMRTELVRALQPYPDARAAVAAVLSQLEGDAAKVIQSTRMIAWHRGLCHETWATTWRALWILCYWRAMPR